MPETPGDSPSPTWSEESETDLEAIWLYVASEAGAGTADNLVLAILAAGDRVARWPQSGRSRPDLGRGLRSVPVQPYLLIYIIKEDVEIVRVVHGRRDLDSAIGHYDPDED